MNEEADYAEVLERWHQCDISRQDMKELMQRSDAKGLARTIAFFAVLIGLGYLAYQLIGTPWMIPAFFAYGTVYCFLNHLMHETHHRTVFKTSWINEVVHWVTAFAHGAEPIYDRWGHAQHHTYTYLEGKDPEVVTPRPAHIPRMLGMLFGIGIIKPLPIIKHALGIIPAEDKELVPESDWKPMIWSSRFWLLGYGLIIGASLYFHTWLPLVYTLFARFYGAFYPTLLNFTQHVGLEENVLDHRRITRNIKVGPITSFIYWDMQYHIEHHMFPGVPFHALKKMHAKIEDQLPPTYPSIWAVYKEMIPTILKQQKEHGYHVKQELPDCGEAKREDGVAVEAAAVESDDEYTWIPVPDAVDMDVNDVIGVKHETGRYALYRLQDGYYASCDKCPHAGALLSRGLVIDGQIECPAHQGRFEITTGAATASPASGKMPCYPVREKDGQVLLGVSS